MPTTKRPIWWCEWFPLDEAVRMALSGEIVNTIAVSGILAAHAARGDFDSLRPVDAPWVDKPTTFARRRQATTSCTTLSTLGRSTTSFRATSTT